MTDNRPDETMANSDSENGDETDDDSSEEEDPLSYLPKYALVRVEALKELHKDHSTLMDTYLTERAALEHKFNQQLQVNYAERAAIVRGDKDDEIQSKSGDTAAVTTSDDTEDPPLPGIPQFWVTIMTQEETVGEIIATEDVECLEYLTDISCFDDIDGKGFTLHFHFDHANNTYFSNPVLTKTYNVPNLLFSEEAMIKNVSGCKIDWKPDKCLTHRKIQKKQRGKGKNAGQVRTVEKLEEQASFFRWFEPPEAPGQEAAAAMDEDEIEKLEEVFQDDYEVAEAFRTNIIPRAVLLFSGDDGPEALFMQNSEDNEMKDADA